MLSALAGPVSALSPVPEDSAKSVMLYEMNTATVLYEKNADEKRLIASLTKIMTALVALETVKPDDVVEIKAEWTAVEGSKMGLIPGEHRTVRELLYGLLLASGNDAALALACHCAGGVKQFAALMVKKAAELGMTSSSFENPHGLDGAGQYSTARDMTVLTAAAMSYPDFAELVKQRTVSVGGRTLVNHNRLLGMYEGTVGVKTGYTDAAGRTLVSCVEREGMRLICVTLCDPNDWNDHMALCDWALENYDVATPVKAGEPLAQTAVISGVTDVAQLAATRSCNLLMEAGSSFTLELSLPHFIYAPVQPDEAVGEVRVLVNGTRVDTVKLVCADGVELDKSVPLSPWEQLKWAWYRVNKNSTYIRYYPFM